ncbi:TauD-domain-containing protein [Fomitiporia mediterranea MF3/22]|uniref:TauD-domain-containing protein n=1 Tax=Fomitiporia mediterranea (strain MF3/22) TaxID=694068 RepID=UPI00044093A4|nr:TauD-domain-containing protein [Fomitiporia mediterranea MF3/22]EJD04418.1 TauD-domain-containing protein [Fomitiporia mediterranea MF3/22]
MDRDGNRNFDADYCILRFKRELPNRKSQRSLTRRRRLSNHATTRVDELTPNFGTEIHGVNLARLTKDERDQVALEVARRGLLVFKDQAEFINSGPYFYLEWGRHFGRLHIHPTSGHPDGYPEIHLVYRDANTTFDFEYEDTITSTVWHSDGSPDLQPPGLTTFFLLAQPHTGGDTLFTSQVSTLKKLSPTFLAFLKTLKALHSSVKLADFSRSGRRGGVVRREPVENIHPVVRRHPVTGEEALYVNKQYTRHIIGLKKEESQNILNFLYNHIAASGDCQTRVHWSPNTVVLWDNRITAHRQIFETSLNDTVFRVLLQTTGKDSQLNGVMEHVLHRRLNVRYRHGTDWNLKVRREKQQHK